MPKRIQLSRKKGWRMPPNTVKVDRTTRWGNAGRPTDERYEQYGKHASRECVKDFKFDVLHDRYPFTASDIKRELRGKNLACWCKLGEPCHADVLLEIANRKAEQA